MKRLLAGVVVTLAALATPMPSSALSVQEAILRAKPATALITARIDAEVTINCGQGPVTVKPRPFVETGTGWFVDGRGWVVTNAHVVDPAHRLPPWVTHELKKTAIDQACVEPALQAQKMARGQRPDLEERLRREMMDVAMAGLRFTPQSQITVLLSNGARFPAEVKKFSAPLLLDTTGKPVKDSGRDLALLKIPDGVYPALSVGTRDVNIGDPVHILGFPGVVLSHELLNQSVTLEASVTNGAISGFRQPAIGQAWWQPAAPAARGNSGGPAIRDDASLVGVLTFVSLSPSGGAIVQGFNFLIPARDVLKFLADTPVKKTGESAFNVAWEAGLDAFFRDRDELAVQKIQEANRLVPSLADVKRTLAEAEDRAKHPRPRPFPWAWTTLGVSMLSVGTYGGMWGRRWWRNRFRVLPAQVIGFIENGLSPLLVEAKSHLPSIGLEIYKNLTLGDVERRRYKAGETIFREGEDAHAEAYVVHTGSVDIRKRVDGGERQLSTLGEGELLGEMALFRKAPRSASALAATDVELLVIKNERLEWLIRNRPQLTIEILKRLSEWVVSTDLERSQRN